MHWHILESETSHNQQLNKPTILTQQSGGFSHIRLHRTKREIKNGQILRLACTDNTLHYNSNTTRQFQYVMQLHNQVNRTVRTNGLGQFVNLRQKGKPFAGRKIFRISHVG